MGFFTTTLVVGLIFYGVYYIYKWIKRRGMYPKNIFLDKCPETLPKHPLPPEEIKEIIERSVYDHEDSLEEKYDAIVIGSGISGMVTAGLLSKADKKVLLLEQHDRLGGLTHCFEEKGFNFCVGVHFVVDLTPDINLVSGGFIKQRPHATGELYEIGGESLRVTEDKYKDLKISLLEKFPHEKEALEKYFGVMEKTGNSTKYAIYTHFMPYYVRWLWWLQGKTGTLYHQHGNASSAEILDECGVKDPLLRWFLRENALAYYNPNYPGNKNFSLHARFNMHLLPRKKIIYGPYGVGGDNFAKVMIPNILSNGKSQALCNAEVKRIIFDERKSDRAIGVDLGDGKKVYADQVISSVGIENTMKLMPKMYRKRTIYPDLLSKVPYTGFFFVIFIGFDLPAEELGIENGIHCIQKSADPEYLNQYFAMESPDFEEFKDRYLMWLFALDTFEKEYEWYGKKSQVQILVPVNPEWFERFEDTRYQQRGREYEEVKENLTNCFLEVLYERFPKTADHIDYMDSGSNLTYYHYCRSPKGAGYALCYSYDKMNTCMDNMKQVCNPMPNLFVVGGDTYSCGIGGQMLSSYFACGKILKRNMFIDMLAALPKKKKKSEEEEKEEEEKQQQDTKKKE